LELALRASMAAVLFVKAPHRCLCEATEGLMAIRKKIPAAEVGQRRGYFSDIGLSEDQHSHFSLASSEEPVLAHALMIVGRA
jgi:hypothetical protein